MPDPEKERERETFDSPREAAADLAARREAESAPVVEVGYQTPDGDKVPTNETVSLEKAAKDLTAYRAAVDDLGAKSVSSDFAEAIDKMRSEVLKANPELATEFGIDPDLAKVDEKTDPKRVAEKQTKEATNNEAANDGIDPKLAEQIRSHPQVREFIASEVAETQQTKQAYSAALEQARVASLATLAEVVPHLAGLPPAQFEQGLALLSEVDPPAFQRALNVLQRTHSIVQAQQHAHQQEAQIQQQQFVSHVRSEDARLVEMMGDKAAAEAANQATISYLGERGVPQDQMLHVFANNPVLRTAEARKTIWEAQKYREIQKTVLPRPTREVPKVQRPGTSQRRSSDDGTIAALERQLSSATGRKAIEAAAKLTAARRK